MEHDVSVVITVGPNSCYKEYLSEAIESVLAQTYLISQIVVVDDGAKLDPSTAFGKWFYEDYWLGREAWFRRNIETRTTLTYFQMPCRVGYAQAFNCGMAVTTSNLVLCLAADDKLYPEAVVDCVETYIDNNQKDAWYNMSYELQNGTTHSAFNNICMVTKSLWEWLDGYPPSAFAAPDALLISILMKHAPDRLIKVKEGKINCWLRQHPDQDTLKQAAFFMASGVVNTIRDMETKRFVPNKDVKLR